MKKAKIPAIFGVPRSGTTPLYSALYPYFEQTRGLIGLSEYFNPIYQTFRLDKTSGKIITEDKPELIDSPRLTAAEMAKVQAKRLKILLSANPIYWFKILTNHSTPRLCFQLSEHCDFIFITRRNLFENFLSFAISATIRAWYKPGGLKVPNASIPYSPHLIHGFKINVTRYANIKSMLTPKHEIVFEDFLSHRNKLVPYFASLGFDQPWNAKHIVYPDKQNPENKLGLFEAPERFIEDYRSSSLQKIFAIDKEGRPT